MSCASSSPPGLSGPLSEGASRLALPPALPAETWIIHAGTTLTDEQKLVSSGGRVLGVCARAGSLRAAADRAYAACNDLGFASKYFRRDIWRPPAEPTMIPVRFFRP